ncbi:hypothetical protein V1520DRAFT_339783 [Lipomyces starkeyi]|uniref:Cation-transporting ATPase n=1 Tax=Lipomyces starkeyi NRRL Y-11557 TaxID=675824 RepID=A0A1E3Q1Z6_LIPST|nr:hypothetical protein LIPSTDRAFT_73414 [Lipomyces starkeyi NRRL Y-11557]
MSSWSPLHDANEEQSPDRPQSPSSSSSNASVRGRRGRRDSTATEASYYGEMAQDRMFDGPVPDSVPSSISTFAHRQRSRSRSVSTTRSFRFFDTAAVERAHEIDQQIHGYQYDDDDEYGSDVFADHTSIRSTDEIHSLHTVNTNGSYRPHRGSFENIDPSKQFNRQDSTDMPLLDRSDSYEGLPTEPRQTPDIVQQTVYLSEEDLILALAGYKSSTHRIFIFVLLCICTCGLAYLILRWLPRYRVYLMGRKAPLSKCDWVVLENQWGELSFHNVIKRRYNFPMSSVFNIQKNPHKPSADLEYDPLIPVLQYFDYRYMRLILHPIEGKFVLNNDWRDISWTNLNTIRNGLESATIEERGLVFGENSIEIEDKTVLQLLVEEALHPFYIFQLFSMILWALDEYYYYAACIFVISVISITNTLIETKSNMRRLREISRFVCNVRVLRDGFWVNIPSTSLVPGDVYEISDPSLGYFPCDSIQLTGDSIVNESMLTGESIPVSKYSATAETLYLLADSNLGTIVPELAKNFLFCGTKIVRVRKPQVGNTHSAPQNTDEEAVALALAVKTGFNTTKGALIRSMLFPKPSGFKFYRDSFLYIAVMSMMAALGFIFYTITFVKLGLPASLIAFRSLDLITIVVPPALPATLTIGTNIALSRLKKKDIFCISPSRVNVGGKLDVVCFDKTGTLTEDGLDVLGVHVVNQQQSKFSDLLPSATSVVPTSAKDVDSKWNVRLSMLFAMATCHSLRLIDEDLLGDPLDYKMFTFTGWTYEEDGNYYSPEGQDVDRSPTEYTSLANESNKLAPLIMHPPAGLARNIVAGDADSSFGLEGADLGVIRCFEFVSQLRRMSVIVKRFKDPDMQVFVKGAPEIMRQICKPESFPADYDEMLHNYTHKGYRVIGVAAKRLQRLSWFKAQKLKREDVEKDLAFVGFIVFENKLKPSTTAIIHELGEAKIRTVMCTGDNVLTAISVGRECRLVRNDAPVFIPHFEENTILRWECVDDPELILDSTTLVPILSRNGSDYSPEAMRHYTLAITGDVFRWIMNCGTIDVINKMLIKASIYARMSPDEKHELVEKLQGIDYSVGFCGDGANDCGALKAADVGISLSEAEASVAAPFTSRVFEISCVPDVIREGRASLVTSFSCFKYMSLYSAIQFSTVGILYKSGTNLGDFQFLLIDMFLILPIAVFMAWAGPYPILCPKRPTANLVSQKILMNLIGQIIINVMFQFTIWTLVKQQPWYMPPVAGADDQHVQSSDNTSLFLASCYQYIFIAMVLSVGPPYRERMTKNGPFMLMIAVTVTVVSLILLVPPKWLFNLLVLTPLSFAFKLVILGAAFAYFGVAWVGEKYLFPKISAGITRTRRGVRGGRTKTRKRFKVLIEEHEQEFQFL